MTDVPSAHTQHAVKEKHWTEKHKDLRNWFLMEKKMERTRTDVKKIQILIILMANKSLDTVSIVLTENEVKRRRDTIILESTSNN